MAPVFASGLDLVSSRMRDAIAAIVPKIDSSVSSRSSSIDLATAKNWLLRPELQEIYKEGIQRGLSSKELSYAHGLGGDGELRAALAELFNKHFGPLLPVTTDQVVAAPGATHCLDALLTTICDEGDSVLVPIPFWSGFNLHFHLRPRVKVVPVRLHWKAGSFNESSKPLSHSLLPALYEAVETMSDKTRVKALVMTNPNNPLGQCYPAHVLQECIDFCGERGIHYISDELYAFSRVGGSHFVSALRLSTRRTAVNGATKPAEERSSRGKKRPHPDSDGSRDGSPAAKRRNGTVATNGRTNNGLANGTVANTGPSATVHVLWSTSKDLCSSGLRMAALVSQSPQSTLVLKSVALLSSMHLSSLASLATLHLLHSAEFPGILALLSSRLAAAHKLAAARFRRWGTPFFTVEAGPFVLVRLGSIQDEGLIQERLARAGVLVASGSSFGSSGWCDGDGEFWARITVAVPAATFWDGLNRIEFALGF